MQGEETRVVIILLGTLIAVTTLILFLSRVLVVICECILRGIKEAFGSNKPGRKGHDNGEDRSRSNRWDDTGESGRGGVHEGEER